MRMISFSVQNYRSITNANRLSLGNSTVLVGPNNEGKSNVLKALVTAMRVLKHGQRNPRSFRFNSRGEFIFTSSWRVPPDIYDWENDYPISLQESQPKGVSTFSLEFSLPSSEVDEFKREIKSSLNGSLPLSISVGAQNVCAISVKKKGPGGAALSAKSARIAQFVSERLEFQYIPAVRNARSAEEVVQSLVERELLQIESAPEYKAALEEIAKIQRPVLEKLSASLKPTMVKFLPAIRNVEFEIAQQDRYRALRRAAKMIVDDGTPTYLEYKGDGVQSLAALGLMRHASEEAQSKKNFVIAVEEPESHLHPEAIYALRGVLQELSEKHQVIITTHNPIFVDRTKAGANIIVQDRRAKAAKSIEQIRDILGVRAADNLRHAEIVLLVEGADDLLSIRALLSHYSKELSAALSGGFLAVEPLNGGTNLAYKASLVRASLCGCHAFLDFDRAGRESAEKAKLEGVLLEGDLNFATCPGLVDSEFEDLIDVPLYEAMILNTYRVSLQSPKFRGNRKWSDRMKEVFKNQGKNWDDRVEAKLKGEVAELVASNPGSALNQNKRSAIDGLISSLEIRLKEKG